MSAIGTLLLLLAADVVVLADGQEITGVAAEEGEQITVRLDFGSVSFPRSEVVEIRRESTQLHELEQRRARLDANDVPGRIALARWAEQNGMAESARELYREVLSLKPNDPIARERLMTEEERLIASGHVRYGGRWVTKDEAESLEKEATERRTKREEQERLQDLEKQVALQQEKIEELESRPAPAVRDDEWISSGHWLPHHPVFAYGHFLPFHQPLPRPAPRPHVGLRGRLRAQRGSVSANAGVRAQPPLGPRP